jgi:quinol-cytochrome oxidoreductase complex cytochrome b subunit
VFPRKDYNWRIVRPSFFHHLHPPTIPAPQARFRYTLGAGGLSVYLVLVVIVTGILAMFYYVPTPEGAAESIQTLSFLVPLGWLVRNLHYWSAQALIVVAAIHLLRVVLTGAYAPPRRLNYLVGLGLLVLCLLLDFSGYVLRWDEGVRWALVTGTNLLKTIPGLGPGVYGLVIGGDEPGPATVIRFYAWHVFGLTLLLVGVGVWHIFRVRRDGGIALPPPAARADPSRIHRDELVRREVLAALLATAILVLLSAARPAPIAAPIGEEGIQVSDARAPWFFLWVQQLLRWGDPFVLGVLIPTSLLIFIGILPYLLPNAAPSQLGTWFPAGNRSAQFMIGLTFMAILILTTLSLIPSSPVP